MDQDDGITAYHGSPHDFEQFDTSKIGTGEGAQAYGHGLYFAQNEDVARGYRDNISRRDDPREAINDVVEQFKNGRVAAPTYKNVKKWIQDIPALQPHKNDDQIISRLHEIINAKDDDDAFNSYKELDNLLPHPSRGHMYEVHINAHPDHFADWDEPMSRQPEKVQKYFNFKPVEKPTFSVVETGLENPYYKYAVKGYPAAATPELALSNAEQGFEDLLMVKGQTLAAAMEKGGRKKISEDLAKLGVPGIKYLDAGSRSRTDKPTRNYVVFDHNHVAVKRKYARGGVVG